MRSLSAGPIEVSGGRKAANRTNIYRICKSHCETTAVSQRDHHSLTERPPQSHSETQTYQEPTKNLSGTYQEPTKRIPPRRRRSPSPRPSRRRSQSFRSVLAIRKHLGEMVSSSDTFAAQGFEAVRDLALKRIYEKLQAGEGKLGELSVVAGVSADKLDSLRGRSQPSQVHQHIHISHAKVSDILSSLPSGEIQSPVHGPKDPEKPAQVDEGSHLRATPGNE